MTPEQLVGQLRQALGGRLRAVVRYGSAVAGDYLPGRSNDNILVVVDRLGTAELTVLAAPAVAWFRAGNRPPLLFTPAELAASADVFAIELRDIQQSHTVLFGDDPLVGITIKPEHLRLQLERELKGKLITLREAFLLTQAKPRRIRKLMAESVTSFLVLFRAALRLYQEAIPATKLDALRALAGHVGFDPAVFLTIHNWKTGSQARGESAESLFERYLSAIEQVVNAVDRHLHPTP